MLSDQVRFARAQGIEDSMILRRHVLKAISIPIVTVFGLELGSTVAFAVVTETIFNWPGLGKLVIDSITTLDRPVLSGYLILVAALFITINLVVDLVYALLDPRLRPGGGR
jgi:peptide/nickel transport system permease protein